MQQKMIDTCALLLLIEMNTLQIEYIHRSCLKKKKKDAKEIQVRKCAKALIDGKMKGTAEKKKLCPNKPCYGNKISCVNGL